MIRFAELTSSGYTSNICIAVIELGSSASAMIYCVPSPTNGTSNGDYFDRLGLGSNSNFNSGGTGTAVYKDYTNQSTDIAKNISQGLTAVEGCYAPDRYTAWIECNQYGHFSDKGPD